MRRLDLVFAYTTEPKSYKGLVSRFWESHW
jgi:hypothetical protein